MCAAEIERTSRSPPNENILQSTLRHGKSQVSSLLNGSSPTYTSAYRLVPNTTTNGHTSSITSVSNGPTDLSMKKSTSNQLGSPVKHSLNPSEVIAVKQLIAGYRESAAFLLRSADELEQLLLQQN
ncbi:Nucleolar protein 4-like like protein [Argiope bruennichi]|uniref:Nucleolar protein 4-like like protein n=1 Tax=Argiope bruennichi TaxID=94029 RepID=A0A8T0F451_ARGBR|nr:Nucleolar protein 4-like like protein [Argiope bruennichi]